MFGGDGVWEIDPAGAKPPRLILKDLGGFNGFDIGPDGKLYGPLWFKQQVVRIDPDTGELDVVADGFDTPAAANFDSKWNLYVLDTARGEVVRVDIRSGKKQVVARLATALDNLAIDSHDRVFVSNMADNGIQEVDVDKGTARQVVKGALAIPLGIAAVADGTRDTLYVAMCSHCARVDAAQGKVTDVARSHAADTPIGYPVAVTANQRHVIVTNNEGPVQRYERGTMRLVQSWRDTHAGNAIEMPSGALIVAETTRGKLSKITGSGEREQRCGDRRRPRGPARARNRRRRRGLRQRNGGRPRIAHRCEQRRAPRDRRRSRPSAGHRDGRIGGAGGRSRQGTARADRAGQRRRRSDRARSADRPRQCPDHAGRRGRRGRRHVLRDVGCRELDLAPAPEEELTLAPKHRRTLDRSLCSDDQSGALMRAFFGQYFGAVLILLGLALVLTAVVFRKRWFERGTVPRKGEPADVRQDQARESTGRVESHHRT